MDIYAFDPPTPADAGTLSNVAVNSTDEVLKGLLREDINSAPRRIAGWENHRENLPEDPSQVTCAHGVCVCVSLSFPPSRHINFEHHPHTDPNMCSPLLCFAVLCCASRASTPTGVPLIQVNLSRTLLVLWSVAAQLLHVY